VSAEAPLRFWAANVGSAIFWAPTVFAPGALAGVGLGRLFEAGLNGQDWLTLDAIVVPAIAAGFLVIRVLRRQQQPRAGCDDRRSAIRAGRNHTLQFEDMAMRLT
jgi:membrane protein DedA with SNARE-associated domain